MANREPVRSNSNIAVDSLLPALEIKNMFATLNTLRCWRLVEVATPADLAAKAERLRPFGVAGAPREAAARVVVGVVAESCYTQMLVEFGDFWAVDL